MEQDWEKKLDCRGGSISDKQENVLNRILEHLS